MRRVWRIMQIHSDHLPRTGRDRESWTFTILA